MSSSKPNIHINREKYPSSEEYHKAYAKEYRKLRRDYFDQYQKDHRTQTRRNELLQYSVEKFGIDGVNDEIDQLKLELESIRRKNRNLLTKIKQALDKQIDIKVKLKLNKNEKSN